MEVELHGAVFQNRFSSTFSEFNRFTKCLMLMKMKMSWVRGSNVRSPKPFFPIPLAQNRPSQFALRRVAMIGQHPGIIRPWEFTSYRSHRRAAGRDASEERCGPAHKLRESWKPLQIPARDFLWHHRLAGHVFLFLCRSCPSGSVIQRNAGGGRGRTHLRG